MSHRHLSLVIPPAHPRMSRTGFYGEFNLATRERFRQIRRELGLSLQQLGDFLQINWSTIRKWETGISRTCHARHVSRIANFLNHCYDDRLRVLNEPNCSILSLMQRLPTPLRTEMEHAWTTYGVAKCYPGECTRLLRLLDGVVDRTAAEILNQCVPKKAKKTISGVDSSTGALEVNEQTSEIYVSED